MKTPSFWYSNEKSLRSTLLLPVAQLYDTINTIKRAYTTPLQLPIPVICIGNAVAGGAGKTPVCLHIGQMLREKGINAVYLSRGYGGTVKDRALLVNPDKHTAAMVGDEPLLLASILPTIVSPNRVLGAQLALKKNAEVIIMDDGYQNPSLFKTLSILVIDGTQVYGNNRLIPAGPLREKASSAMARAHMVIVINRTNAVPLMPREKAIYYATTQFKNAALFKQKKLYAFCGIARPEKFFNMLSNLGAKLVATKAFPDHHPYSISELNQLLIESTTEKAVLVTTEKDLMRIPKDLHDCMITADLELKFDNPGSLSYVLDYVLGRVDPSKDYSQGNTDTTNDAGLETTTSDNNTAPNT